MSLRPASQVVAPHAISAQNLSAPPSQGASAPIVSAPSLPVIASGAVVFPDLPSPAQPGSSSFGIPPAPSFASPISSPQYPWAQPPPGLAGPTADPPPAPRGAPLGAYGSMAPRAAEVSSSSPSAGAAVAPSAWGTAAMNGVNGRGTVFARPQETLADRLPSPEIRIAVGLLVALAMGGVFYSTRPNQQSLESPFFDGGSTLVIQAIGIGGLVFSVFLFVIGAQRVDPRTRSLPRGKGSSGNVARAVFLSILFIVICPPFGLIGAIIRGAMMGSLGKKGRAGRGGFGGLSEGGAYVVSVLGGAVLGLDVAFISGWFNHLI